MCTNLCPTLPCALHQDGATYDPWATFGTRSTNKDKMWPTDEDSCLSLLYTTPGKIRFDVVVVFLLFIKDKETALNSISASPMVKVEL